MIDAPQPTNRNPQPTNRKLRRTALSPEPPGPPGTPVSTAPAEQAPLSRGRERRSGDCPATAATPVGADSISARPAAPQSPREGHDPPLQTPATARPNLSATNPTTASVGAHIVRPGNPAAAQTPAGGINPAPTAPGDRPATRVTPAATKPAKRTKRRGKGDTTPPTPADIIKLRRRRCADAADIVSFFTKLVAMIALLAVLLGLAFGITPMPNDDMAPRISAGDLLLYYRLADDWANGDVMVFEKDGEQYVGRIVARGGDTVEVTDQATLVVNGSTVLENNIYYTTPKYENGPAYPLTLAAGEFFVLCDYREGARDSRYFGAVRPAEVKGKVITVVRRSGL